jgi:hypothetical protein
MQEEPGLEPGLMTSQPGSKGVSHLSRENGTEPSVHCTASLLAQLFGIWMWGFSSGLDSTPVHSILLYL